MVDFLEDDDELEDDSKKKPQQQQSVGAPIVAPAQAPTPPAKSVGQPIAPVQPAPAATSSVGAPIVPPTTGSAPTPTPPTIADSTPPPSIGTPINIAPPLGPASQRASALAAQGPPELHGWRRALDTVAGATKIGQAAEAAGGWGTTGYEAKLGRAQRAAGVETGQTEAGQKEQQNTAQTADTQAQSSQREAQTAQIGESVPVTGPGGQIYSIPKKDLEKYLGTEATVAGAGQRNTATNENKIQTADIGAGSREAVAGQKPETRVMGNKTEERQPDGSWKDVGAAPPNAAGIARPQLMYVPQPDGSYQAIQVSPGSTVPGNAETGTGVNTMSTPTAQSRNMGEMASTVLQQTPRIIDEVKTLQNKFGPAAGRWNELYANKIGADDPEFTGLDSDLDLLSSAIVRTHFGAKGGQQYREALKKQFGEAQTADDLISRIQHADEWIQGYAKMAGHGGGGPQVGDVVKGFKFKGGDPHQQSNWEQVTH